MDRRLLAWGVRPRMTGCGEAPGAGNGGHTPLPAMLCPGGLSTPVGSDNGEGIYPGRQSTRARFAVAGISRRTPIGVSPMLPRLWLFTDSARLPDPRAAVAALPRGRAGVVLRHDSDPDRAGLGRDLARICRERRLVLVVAGDLRLAAALGAGVHLRSGRWRGFPRPRGGRWAGYSRPQGECWPGYSHPQGECWPGYPDAQGGRGPGIARPRSVVTSSAHSARDLWRAARSGAHLTFLSPVFATSSHPGTAGLGPLRWGAMVQCLKPGRSGMRLGALGGVDGISVRRLRRDACYAVGAISALAP